MDCLLLLFFFCFKIFKFICIHIITFHLYRSDYGSRQTSPTEKHILTIYDLDNKFIAYSAAFDDVIDVLAEWGSFYVLTRDKTMYMLQEKDTQTKLEVSTVLLSLKEILNVQLKTIVM